MSLPQLIPVLDLMTGQVVRGVAGNRESYQPIQSRLVAGSEPVDVAMAVKKRFGINEFYIADLDAIRFDSPQWDQLRNLVEAGFTLSVDAGVRESSRASDLFAAGVQRVILGLESLQHLKTVSEMLALFGEDRIVFSLDLKKGTPIGPAAKGLEPIELAREVLSVGLKRMLVLDLAAVGVGQGIPTLPLCRQILDEHSEVILWTGGGVRGPQDLVSAVEAGIAGVLVASAIHDGSLQPG